MAKLGLLFFSGIIVGLIITSLVFIAPFSPAQNPELAKTIFQSHQPQVIGFLPYWLLDKAQDDYSKYINTLAYFSLTIDADGKILKLTNPREEDPGWLSFNSPKLKSILNNAKNHHQSL